MKVLTIYEHLPQELGLYEKLQLFRSFHNEYYFISKKVTALTDPKMDSSTLASRFLYLPHILA